MDLGLDVEGYKDYVNNLKIFAKYNKDWEILANDMKPIPGFAHGPLSHNEDGLPFMIDQDELDFKKLQA